MLVLHAIVVRVVGRLCGDVDEEVHVPQGRSVQGMHVHVDVVLLPRVGVHVDVVRPCRPVDDEAHIHTAARNRTWLDAHLEDSWHS